MKTIEQLCEAVEFAGVDCDHESGSIFVHVYGNSEPATVYDEDQFIRFCEYFLGDEELE